MISGTERQQCMQHAWFTQAKFKVLCPTSQCRDHLALLAPAVTQDLQESRVQLDLKVHVVVTVWMVTRDTQAHEVTLVHL